MHDHVAGLAKTEVCGLLGGVNNSVTCIIPITNSLASPRRFLMDPEEQITAFKYIEENGWDIIGIYHSHLTGKATPSRTDIREAAYPDVAYLIWSQQHGIWGCRAFRIKKGSFDEIMLKIRQKRATD
jgi:[CysO sulfur-carrier protein]-S-L-cysteine hydrolase